MDAISIGGGRHAAPLLGEVTLTGDKSVSHRALILAALATGPSRVRGLNDGLDVAATAACLRALGVAIGSLTNPEVIIEPPPRGLHEPAHELDAGNSGSTLRMLLGVLAGLDGRAVVTGDDSLRRRPMGRVVIPLRRMGAHIDGRRGGDLAPLTVRGARLHGIDLVTEVASAQVKTALLLAGLTAEGTTSVTEPHGSRDHTELMLAAAGVELDRRGTTVAVRGGQRPQAATWVVPHDLSGALFPLTAAVLVPGSDVAATGVGLNPTRRGALDALGRMGANITVTVEGYACGEPVGCVRAVASRLIATTIHAPEVPGLVDELPLLAVAATQAEGRTEIRGAGELRLKESDRIAALVAGVNALGGAAEELADGLVVRGPTPLRGGVVSSAGDHRIAMAFAIAALTASDPVLIEGWSGVATSWPGFLDALRALHAASQAKR